MDYLSSPSLFSLNDTEGRGLVATKTLPSQVDFQARPLGNNMVVFTIFTEGITPTAVNADNCVIIRILDLNSNVLDVRCFPIKNEWDNGIQIPPFTFSPGSYTIQCIISKGTNRDSANLFYETNKNQYPSSWIKQKSLDIK
jgi:hypothetical protein